MPKSGSGVHNRRNQAKVPSKVRFATLTQLADVLQSVFTIGMRPVSLFGTYDKNLCLEHDLANELDAVKDMMLNISRNCIL